MNCNSCYAFGVTGVIEIQKAINDNKDVEPLSEQYVLNCGHKSGLNGCDDGKFKNTFEFSWDFGVVLEKDLPYYGYVKKCDENLPIAYNTKSYKYSKR